MKIIVTLCLLLIASILYSQEYRVDSSYYYSDLSLKKCVANKVDAKLIIYQADSLKMDVINNRNHDTLRLWFITTVTVTPMARDAEILGYFARSQNDPNPVMVTLLYIKKELISVGISDSNMLLILIIKRNNEILPGRQTIIRGN